MTATRRPIASRDSRWAKALARRLAASRVTPNMISQASVGFAAVAGGCFWAAGGAGLWLLLPGALAVQGRLVCNLIDGMVAIEGGQKAPDGPFWNEAPDRAADILIIAGLGLGSGLPVLGWAAATLAVLTAYLRELGRAEGMAPDFSGPLAKPQRMALVTLAAPLAFAEPLVTGTSLVLPVALWLLVVGTGVTALRRARRLVLWLRSGGAG